MAHTDTVNEYWSLSEINKSVDSKIFLEGIAGLVGKEEKYQKAMNREQTKANSEAGAVTKNIH